MFDQVSVSVIVTGEPFVEASALKVSLNIMPAVAVPRLLAEAKPTRTKPSSITLEMTIEPFLKTALLISVAYGFASSSASITCSSNTVGS